MRLCTHCSKVHAGDPPFCAGCGRSFAVRICHRGHRNPRGAAYCAECGSAELSTPAPAPSWRQQLAATALSFSPRLLVVAVTLGALAALAAGADWAALLKPLARALPLAALAWWLWTLLPRPVKSVAKAVGRAGRKAMTTKRKRQ